MACSGQPCEWIIYQANRIINEHEEWSGECNDEIKKKLREKLMGNLANAVAKDTKVISPCPEKGCVCFAEEDKEPTKGWESAGLGSWTQTVKEGTCKLTGTLKYEREAKHIPGHCYDPMPKSPGAGEKSAKESKKQGGK
jgi:hypothetical protein